MENGLVVESLEDPESLREPSLDGKVEAAIGAWLVERIYSSPVSMNTEAMNYLRSVLDDLRDRIVLVVVE